MSWKHRISLIALSLMAIFVFVSAGADTAGKSKLDVEVIHLGKVIEEVAKLLSRPVRALASGRSFTPVWPARGP